MTFEILTILSRFWLNIEGVRVSNVNGLWSYMKARRTFCTIGWIQWNKDNARQPARTRAPQVNDGSTHCTHVSWFGRLRITRNHTKIVNKHNLSRKIFLQTYHSIIHSFLRLLMNVFNIWRHRLYSFVNVFINF